MVVPVWIDDWQQECCGDAFAVGDAVRWTLVVETDSQAWRSRLLGDRHPDWVMSLAVDTVVEDTDMPTSLARWAIVCRGQLAISVALPQAQQGPAPGDSLTVGAPAREDHGGAPQATPPTPGIVRRIRVARCRYVAEEPEGGLLVPMRDTATLTDTSQVPHGVVALDEDNERRFVGYLVDLEIGTDREATSAP